VTSRFPEIWLETWRVGALHGPFGLRDVHARSQN
jgi:hypothetical protein